jgi:glycosyltransferase involved in cell wall biosynthesis
MELNSRPLVSVIIPCYNQGHYLEECIHSVKASDYLPLEIIVVDDGSVDSRSVSIFDQFPFAEVRLIRQQNGGLSQARNTGIQASSGKYILPLDADDKISPHYINQAVELLERDPELKIVYSEAEYFGAKNGVWPLPEFDEQVFFTQNLIFCSAIFRRTDYDQTAGYNSNMKFGFEDWDFWMSLLETGGKVYRIPEAHFFYRVTPGSMVRSFDAEKMAYLRKRIFLNHLDYYIEKFQDPVNLFWIMQSHLTYKKDYENLLNTTDYKLGRALLSPFRRIKALFAR